MEGKLQMYAIIIMAASSTYLHNIGTEGNRLCHDVMMHVAFFLAEQYLRLSGYEDSLMIKVMH